MPNRIQLTFYLFRPSVKNYEDALICDENTLLPEGYEQVELNADFPFECNGYLQQKKEAKPPWMDFIAPHCKSPDLSKISNESNSFVLLIRLHNGKAKKPEKQDEASIRMFAITAGHGHATLNRKHLEREFGLRCTLNSLDPGKIKSIDVRNLDPRTRQTRTLVNRGSPLYEFRLDLDEDLIKLISGQPTETSLGTKMQGSDSLTLASCVTFSELGEKCVMLLQAYGQKLPSRFKFIDDIRVVHSEEEIKDLDDLLVDRITSGTNDGIAFAFPGLDDQFTARYRLHCGHKSLELSDLTVADLCDFAATLLKDGKSVGDLLLRGYNDDDEFKSFDFREVVIFDCPKNNECFLLSGGIWYLVANDYVAELDAFVSAIPSHPIGLLPPIKANSKNDKNGKKKTYLEHEEIYNKRVTEGKADMACLDKNLIRSKDYGKGSIEACDILMKDGKFICVKKNTSSACLSHLFAQASVSAQLLCRHPQYHRDVMDHCRPEWALRFRTDPNVREEIDFIYAIATSSNASWVKTLPFFSKVNIRAHTNQITALGFTASLLRIPVDGVADNSVVDDDYDAFADDLV